MDTRRPMSKTGLLLAAVLLLQLLTPTAAGWSLLKKALGFGNVGAGGSAGAACKPVAPQKDVDLQAYTGNGKRWYIHQQVRGVGRMDWMADRVSQSIDGSIRSVVPSIDRLVIH
jgi:hypothetical protein